MIAQGDMGVQIYFGLDQWMRCSCLLLLNMLD